MKQVQFTAFGQPAAVVACVDVPEVGPPGRGEVVVAVDAFPINPADLLMITGGYAVKPELPATLGAEGTGRIVAVGAGVDDFQLGDRVIMLSRNNWCQQRCLPAEEVIAVPDGADVLQVAMLKVNPATAWMMLRNYVRLESGDWLIQNAANSGVGQALISLAAAEGVRSVSIIRRADPAPRLQALGADVVLVDGENLAERVAEATGQAPIRLAIDAVAGRGVMDLGDCLAEGGTIVNYGLLSGEACQLRADQIIFKGITLTGFWLQKMLTTMARPEIEQIYRTLAERVASNQLAVDIEATYPIDQIKDAVAHASRSHRQGKILVLPNGSPPS